MRQGCKGLIALFAALAFLSPMFGEAANAPVNASPARPSRAELYSVLDRYLTALKARDPARVPWATVVHNSENNVELMVGDGLWGTITGMSGYDLRFADPDTGQVGFFGSVKETTDESPYTLRLKVAGGKVTEAETLVVRAADSGIKFPDPKFQNKPVLNEMLPAAQRMPRERMISVANGYFDTLQLNDGQLFTQFDPNCNRVENGVQTTNNPQLTFISVAKLGCEAQFKTGNYRYDDRLRARRYPLIDEERGLVLASAFIDHAGRLGKYNLADGTPVESPLRRPHSFYLFELFKVKNGRIEQIEANFVTVPYHMPSPWEP